MSHRNMSMKRFLSRSSNKTTAGQGDDTSASIGSDLPIVPLPSNQSGESHDSIKELGPMFRQQQNKQIADNDDSYDMMHLNLNPTILNLNKTVPQLRALPFRTHYFQADNHIPQTSLRIKLVVLIPVAAVVVTVSLVNESMT